jgi:hypothetical protein
MSVDTSGYRRKDSSRSSVRSAGVEGGTVTLGGIPVYVDKTAPPGMWTMLRKQDLPSTAKPLRLKERPRVKSVSAE